MSAHKSQTNLFGQEPPQRELFHYTSAEGLKGMASGRTLWATNIEYLNDSAEFKHGEEVMRQIVASRKRGAKGDRREFFDIMDESPNFFEAEDVFVISLSEADDLLSQWRGYTPSNCGFCIGFDPQSLTEALWALDEMQLVRCVYEGSEQKKFVTALLDFCLEMWVEHRQAERREAKDFRDMSSIVLFKVYSTFVAAAMKHSAFAEEKEWRLLGLCRDPKRFQFRPGKSTLTPYIELKWGDGTKAQDTQPIRSVTVGPCPDPKLASKAVSRLLKSCGLKTVQVKSSQIPFRSW